MAHTGNAKSFDSRIITSIFFMSRAITEKNAFADFRKQFIPLMRREKDKAKHIQKCKEENNQDFPCKRDYGDILAVIEERVVLMSRDAVNTAYVQ